MVPTANAGLVRSLKHRQRDHITLLAKVEKSAARLARRKEKLMTLETAIADLERRLAEPRRPRQEGEEAGPGTRRAQLIFNPASGPAGRNNDDRLMEIVSGLRTHGVEAAIGLKTSGKAARVLARDAVRKGLPLVVVAAGDGTILDVASQLVGTTTAMGIVPIGTMNNIARSLGVPLEIEGACALIGMGTTRHIDMGRVHAAGDARDAYFLECAGVGLAAIGNMAGQAFEKRHWRALPRGLRRFFEARPGTMRIELDDTTIDASTRVVTVSNAPLMGNNLLAAPEAKMDDGYLDVSVYDGMGDSALLGHFLAASSHTPDGLKSYRARRIRITSGHMARPGSDTDAAPGQDIIEIDVIPAALSVIVGNGIGLTVPVGSAPSAPTYAPPPPVSNGAGVDPTHPPAPARV